VGTVYEGRILHSATSGAFPVVGSDDLVWYRPETMPTIPTGPPSMPSEALTHADALYRLAYHLSGERSDAEDLVQETFARAFGASKQFAEGTNLRAWLCRILRNAYVDGFRRARANPVRGELEDDPPASAKTCGQEPLRGDEELERLRGVVAEDIEAALATLSLDARTVVLLDLEGFTETELATVLGCAVGTIKSRLTRARAALRAKLADYAR
jgi:RNA polymerase sigma-70 factor (ECF subfamily)